jgi:alpha-tubulin suppressor-like RCC1 family protein
VEGACEYEATGTACDDGDACTADACAGTGCVSEPVAGCGTSGELRVVHVSAGYEHTCGVRTDGSLACWGGNYAGQATPPAGAFAQVSAGGGHTCGIRTDGREACWGSRSIVW